MNYNEAIFTTPWGVDVKVFTRPDTNDWNTLYSCLVEDEYLIGQIKNIKKGQTAVDIGAHAGGCTLAMLSRGLNVIAVEPLPENAELVMKNVKENGWEDRLTLYNNAIYSIDGDKVILRYGNEATEVGFHHRFIGNTVSASDWQKDLWTEGREIEVETITLDSIINGVESVEILKIDCEGAEWEAFKNPSTETLSKIKKVVAELHHVPGISNIYKDFHKLIGSDFKDKTNTKFAHITNYETIGLAYFEK